MYKSKEEMNQHELLNLKLGRYLSGKIINGQIYYKVEDERL